MKIVQYLSRPNCSLCNEGLLTMQLVKEDVEFELQIINIEEDDALHEKYMLMIPVVMYEGEVIQYGQLDYPTVLGALIS